MEKSFSYFILMHEKLTEDNFLLFCAKRYNNPQALTTEEFIEKLKETIKKRPPLPPAKESNLDVYKMIKKN